MKRFIDFGSIETFERVVKKVQYQSKLKGFDNSGNPILDENAKAPEKVFALGTEKIHGTNGAVSFSNPDGFWVQSRKRIIAPNCDNVGCASFQLKNKDAWLEIIQELSNQYNIDLDKNIITIFFEWCGGNIQKNSCVTGLDKRVFIFEHFKVSPIEPSNNPEDNSKNNSRWLETFTVNEIGTINWVDNPDKNIFNVMNFNKFQKIINFNEPSKALEEMMLLTNEIERNSGIANFFGKPENVGEGIVWTANINGKLVRWKTKGKLHAQSNIKVSKLSPEELEIEKKKISFANDVCTEGRLEQMWAEIIHSKFNGDENKMNKNQIRDFLKLVTDDIMKEESEKLEKMKLEFDKSVKKAVSKIASKWFFSKLMSSKNTNSK